MKSVIKKIISPLLKKRRLNRYTKLCRLLNIQPSEKILDVGCGEDGKSFEIYNNQNFITGIDLFPEKELKLLKDNFIYIQANAEDLSIFRNNEFDIAICIGMLEHIGIEKERKKVCDEIMRVAKKVAIVVPHKYSFIEPHFKIPLFGMFNRKLQFLLIRLFKLHGLDYKKFTYKEGIKRFKSNYQWLKAHEWTQLFKGFKTKSLFFGPILTDLIIYRSIE